jgi:hypothetical protein
MLCNTSLWMRIIRLFASRPHCEITKFEDSLAISTLEVSKLEACNCPRLPDLGIPKLMVPEFGMTSLDLSVKPFAILRRWIGLKNVEHGVKSGTLQSCKALKMGGG